MELTRRHALAGAAALAATPLLPQAPANAAAPMADKQAPSFYRYKVGDVQVTVISDGVNTFALGDSFVLNAKKEEVAAALEKAYVPKDKVSIQFGPLVINSGGKLIVLDTGNGPGAFASSKGAVGQFASNMAAAGFDPNAVDMVVISHFHGDHINGLLNAEGKLAFANAEVLVPSVEWKYFMDDGEMAKQTGERMPGVFKNARRVFEAGLNKKVTPYEWGKEVAPGLLAVETAGHTPGHTPTCCHRARARCSSSPTSPTFPTCLRPTPVGTPSSIRIPPWPRRPAARPTTCWWRTSSRCRASTTRSRGSATSKRTAAVIG
jgi:glyoxylase-like metal-dependent hydrolase (beta-lactamase superfamily II)